MCVKYDNYLIIFGQIQGVENWNIIDLCKKYLEMSFGILEMSFSILEMSFGILEMSFGILEMSFGILEMSFSFLEMSSCFMLEISWFVKLNFSGGNSICHKRLV